MGGGALRGGALAVLAWTIALFDWVAILITGHSLAGLQGTKRFYLQWRARLLAYATFLRDEYPPFGDGPYPASLAIPDEPPARNRATVALRPLMLVPHLVLLALLLVAETVVAFISWLAIIFTGRLGDWLWRFSRDVVGYGLRVEAYALLMHDRYPSFALPAWSAPAPARTLVGQE
jgi:hypothetical protein